MQVKQSQVEGGAHTWPQVKALTWEKYPPEPFVTSQWFSAHFLKSRSKLNESKMDFSRAWGVHGKAFGHAIVTKHQQSEI